MIIVYHYHVVTWGKGEVGAMQFNHECIYITIYMYTPKLSRLGWEETPGLGLGGNKVRHTCTGRMYIGLYMGLTYILTRECARNSTYN